jgi:hypothetical protein
MMDSKTNAAPEPVVLIIADISGYTRYMTANAKTLAHSQTLITELVKSILQEVSLPLEVAKLEGDAVFLFGRKDSDPASRAKQKQVIGQKLTAFFAAFGKKVEELSYATTCNCTACANVGRLRLKLIVHSGEALFHRILDFQELAGVDVIIVHRLLKNSVAADQYLLMTETAQQDVEMPAPARLVKSSESYEDIGRIATAVYYPQATGPSEAEAPAVSPAFGARFRNGWALLLKLWFNPLRLATSGAQPGFQHVTSGATRAGRMGFALLTVLLTPIYVPVSALFVAWRARKQPDETHHHQHGHVHLPDGSCCKKD